MPNDPDLIQLLMKSLDKMDRMDTNIQAMQVDMATVKVKMEGMEKGHENWQKIMVGVAIVLITGFLFAYVIKFTPAAKGAEEVTPRGTPHPVLRGRS